MLKKILVATDLSKNSDNLISSMQDFKAFGTEDVVLCSVIDLKYSSQIPDGLLETTQDLIEKQAETLTGFGYKVKTDISQGLPWTQIMETAKKNKVSLIVSGSHGKSIITELFLGSVVSELIEQS